MRKITPLQIAVFGTYLTIAVCVALGTAVLLHSMLPPGEFRAVLVAASVLPLVFIAGFAVYRTFLWITPLQTGDLAPGSKGEFVSQVNTLFYVVLFYSLTRTHFLPVPLLRVVHLALGAKLGPNTFGGIILDPPLTSVGSNCIIGHDAVLYAHAIEGSHLALRPIVIGDDVTIGALAIVMSDVRIGNGAIVSAGAVVRKGSRIGSGEVWGGVPARLIRPAGVACLD